MLNLPTVNAQVDVAISIQTLAALFITCVLIFIAFFALSKLLS